MPILLPEPKSQSHLQVVFSHRAVSCDLSANATFAEVARKLAQFSPRRYGHAVAIAVTLPHRRD